jgi:hypothetical protein
MKATVCGTGLLCGKLTKACCMHLALPAMVVHVCGESMRSIQDARWFSRFS